MLWVIAILLSLFLPAHAESLLLTLSDTSARSGDPASLDIRLSGTSTLLPSAVQWTLSYTQTQIFSIDVTQGPAAVAANKSVTCASREERITCLLWGLNQTSIPAGIVAHVSVQLYGGLSGGSSTLQLSDPRASSPAGESLPITAAGGVITIVPQASLRGEWRFEETAAGPNVTIRDDSPGGINHGVTVGYGSARFPGVTDGGRVLNGTTDYIRIENPQELRHKSLSICVWIKVRSFSKNFGTVLSDYDGNSHGWFLAVTEDQHLAVVTAKGPNLVSWVTSKAQVEPHRWYYVVITLADPTKTARIYIDGHLDREYKYPGIDLQSAVPFTVGRASWYNGYYLDSVIDDLDIYSGVKNEVEVLSDYMTFFPPLPPVDPVTAANWRFEDPGKDSSGNEHNASISLGTPVSGVTGGAYRFNGISDYWEVPASDAFGPTSFTIRAWIRLVSYPFTNSFAVLVSSYGGNSRGWFLGVNWAGYVVFNSSNVPASSPWLLSNKALGLNQWHHIVATYNGFSGIGTIYVDGVADTQRYFGFTPETAAPLTIGRASWSNTYYLNGDVDELKLYSVFRTAQQVRDDYESFMVPAGGVGPLSKWQFEETGAGAGIQLTDIAGGHHAVTEGLDTHPVPGLSSNARNFDGLRDSAVVAPSSDFASENFTLSTWLKVNVQPTNFGVVFANYDGNSRGWYLGLTSGGLAIFSVNGLPASGLRLLSNRTLVQDNWYHLAVTFDARTREGRMYVNGVLDARIIFPSFTAQSQVGPTFARASWYQGYRLNCALDEAKFFSTVLNPSQVLSEFQGIP